MGDFAVIQTQTGWGQVLESFAAWCRPHPGWRVLDIGCGPGLLPALFQRRGCLAVGIDLDASAFDPAPLHPVVARADALHLPFPNRTFRMVTASNLLFLLPEPQFALAEMARLLEPCGELALLNPSEHMTLQAAQTLAVRRGLQGVARDSLLGWAERAEDSARWSEPELNDLLKSAGLLLVESMLKVGPGLARLARARISPC